MSESGTAVSSKPSEKNWATMGEICLQDSSWFEIKEAQTLAKNLSALNTTMGHSVCTCLWFSAPCLCIRKKSVWEFLLNDIYFGV
jgi:hypothetical protein